MGLSGFFPEATKGMQVIKRRLSEFQGEQIGVDASIWLHTFCNNEWSALCLTSDPVYVPLSILERFKTQHDILTKLNITPIYVFDGCRHPMKSIARAKRDDTVEKAKTWLSNYYSNAKTNIINDNQRKESLKKLKAISYPTNEVHDMIISWMQEAGIEYICALFEAKWQLVSMESKGIIAAIMTRDGDHVILGAQKLIRNVWWNDKEYMPFHRSWLQQTSNKISPFIEYLPELAAFWGCDYIDHLRSDGPVTIINNVLPAYLQCENDISAQDDFHIVDMLEN